MGRRRRRVVRIVKKKLPTVFVCPRCGEEAVRVTIAKDTGHATVLCALCNLRDEFPAHPAAQPIDVYSYFTDRFYGVKEPRAIIPRDRDFQHVPSEETTSEEEITVPASEPTVEKTPLEAEAEKQVPEPQLEVSPPEISKPETGAPPVETKQSSVESASPESEETKESQEESEPFADILENKDKKRYSSTPLPQQPSEQSS